MQLFINECSFREQYHDAISFREAMARLMKLMDLARRTIERRNGRMWRSERLGDARALTGEMLRQSLNHVAGRELKESFTDVVFNKANPAPWESERVHRSDVHYFCRIEVLIGDEVDTGPGELVTDTSIAELAERRLGKADVPMCLVNLDGSSLDGRSLVEVVKQTCEPIALSSVCTEAEFEAWLRQIGDVPPYTSDATDPPRDEQTCLIDRQLYQPTGLFVQGRQVHHHVTRKRYYYVDNLHFGVKAHLEVFDKHGRHLGEASLQGELDPEKRDTAKTFKV